jgi:hypothetical protein
VKIYAYKAFVLGAITKKMDCVAFVRFNVKLAKTGIFVLHVSKDLLLMERARIFKVA